MKKYRIKESIDPEYIRILRALSPLKGQRYIGISQKRIHSLLMNDFRNEPNIKEIKIEYVPSTKYRLIRDKFDWYTIHLVKNSKTNCHEIVFEYKMKKYFLAGLEDVCRDKVVKIGSTGLLS